MEFVEVSGERSDGCRYIQDNYVYKRDTVSKGRRYLKCTSDSCPATGVICPGSTRIKLNKAHVHAASQQDAEFHLFRDSLREKAKDSHCTGFRNVFDAQSARYPEGSLLRGFPAAEQMMRRSRNTTVPPTPRDLDHLHEMLNYLPEWRSYALALNSPQEFFVETRHVDNEVGSRVSVMVSPYFSDLLTLDRIELAMDATFDIRPLHPDMEQVLSLHAFETINERRYCWPCAYVYMEKKDQPSYETGLSTINDAVGRNMHPVSLMLDYEKAGHNAAKNQFPGIETSGCWFHYCNALWGQVRELKLLDLVTGDPDAERCIQKCMALPLLPPGEIENGLIVIEEDAADSHILPSLRPYFTYIRDYWFDDRKVGVDTLSVFELDARTNNAVEKSHYDLFKKYAVQRGAFWPSYDAVRQFDYAQHQDRMRALHNIKIRRNRRHEYEVQDSNIKDMQQKLIEGTLDVPGFLGRACHTVEGLQKRMRNHHINRTRNIIEDNSD